MAGRYSSSLTTTAVLSAVFAIMTNIISVVRSTTTTAQSEWNGTQPRAGGITSSDCIDGDNGGVKLKAEIWPMKYIQSPNYPEPYPDDLRCAWRLQTDPDYVIHLHVLKVDLADGFYKCIEDAVTIYDASWESSPAQKEQLCGADYGRNYISTGTEMFITFKSHSSYSPKTHTGFRLMYEAVLDPERVAQLKFLAEYGFFEAGMIIAYIAAGIVVLGLLALIPFFIVRESRAAMERSRRAHGRESDEMPLLTAPSSHSVSMEAVQGTAGDATGVGGQLAYNNLGNDPQPACRADQHVTARTSSTVQNGTAHTSSASNQNSRLDYADEQGARSGYDVAAAVANGNGDPQASDLLVVL